MAESVLERAEEHIGRGVHKLSSVVVGKFEDGVDAAKRMGKRSSDAMEELMDDTSQRIKRHPAESLVTAFALGFIAGGFLCWMARKK